MDNEEALKNALAVIGKLKAQNLALAAIVMSSSEAALLKQSDAISRMRVIGSGYGYSDEEMSAAQESVIQLLSTR